MGRLWKNGDVVMFQKPLGQTQETYIARRDCMFGSTKEQWSTTSHGFWRPSDEQIDSFNAIRMYCRPRRRGRVYKFQGRDEYNRMIFTVPIGNGYEDRVVVTDWWFWSGVNPDA